MRLQQTGQIKDGETIKIKLSGDGTNIGKRLTVVNFTFTILNEKEVAMGEKGNYVLAVIKTTETYDNLRESLADLRMEMSNLKEISANNCTYKVEYFLALVCGLGRTNEDYACVWCKCPRQQRWDTSKKWSINDPTFGARTIDKIGKFSIGKKFNCKARPLFDFIPMDHVIIDTLHLFLRISDVLIDLLIRELRRGDAIEKKKNFLSKYQHMASYEEFIKSIGISFNFRINKDSKKLEYRDLTGPEKLKLFQNINIPTLLPQCSTCKNKQIQVIWAKFMDTMFHLKLDFTSEDCVFQLQGDIKHWFKLFLKVYQTKDVTPYMHALHCHVPEFLSLYQNIAYYTQQGLEKYNDRASKDFFRSTNHKGVDALKQLFLKKNRIQFLEGAGYERVKNSYKCSNCSNKGHNMKTCTSPCKHCTAPICCAHLVKEGGQWMPTCQLPNN